MKAWMHLIFYKQYAHKALNNPKGQVQGEVEKHSTSSHSRAGKFLRKFCNIERL